MQGVKVLKTVTIFFSLYSISSSAQEKIYLKQAIAKGIENYATLKAKKAYSLSAEYDVRQAKQEYLPNINMGIQQTFGTINGINGPMSGANGLATASSGLPLNSQNWNAAFGALYVTNVNWEFFAFGKAKQRIKAVEAAAVINRLDLQQEIFQHKVKISEAYFNLTAAERLRQSYQKNLERADTLRKIIVARAANGLIPGVDSVQVKAERANAVILLNNSVNQVKTMDNRLSLLLGEGFERHIIDTDYLENVPNFEEFQTTTEGHPFLLYQKSKIEFNIQQERYFKTLYYPTFSLTGIFQSRASGFGNGYNIDLEDYSTNYLKGVKPTRSNYLVGFGINYNLSQLYINDSRMQSQKQKTIGSQHEYDLAQQQINSQLDLAENNIKNALANYHEVLLQVEAATMAYNQRLTLYKNGLTNILDVIQAANVLTRSETDRDITHSNLWQALLLKAAATGNFSLIDNQIK